MPWWMWLAGGFVLLLVELATPSGFFIMFFGVGAILTGVLTSLNLLSGAVPQWFTFTVLSVLALLLQGFGGRCVGIQNEKLVHHDIIDAIENMKRPFKGDWLDCAKKLY